VTQNQRNRHTAHVENVPSIWNKANQEAIQLKWKLVCNTARFCHERSRRLGLTAANHELFYLNFTPKMGPSPAYSKALLAFKSAKEAKQYESS
jgi:hypothetical protein